MQNVITTGPQLRAERRAAEVQATALAREWGKDRNYVHLVELRAVVKPELVLGYRAALRACIDAK